MQSVSFYLKIYEHNWSLQTWQEHSPLKFLINFLKVATNIGSNPRVGLSDMIATWLKNKVTQSYIQDAVLRQRPLLHWEGARNRLERDQYLWVPGKKL
jgi:hypothetical protein